MPGRIIHQSAGILCSHGGAATATAPNPRVKVSGMAVVTVGTPYAIAGCGLASSGVFCTSGNWVSGAARVKVMGAPVAVDAGMSVCTAPGTPLLPVVVQPRAVAM